MPTLTQALADVLEIRGVLAAAVVSVDGEILAGGASDTALLDRITGAVTGALAAGEALSSLVARGPAGAHVGDEWGGDEEDDRAPDGLDDGAPGGSSAGGVGGAGRSAVAGGAPVGGKQLMVIYEDSGPIVLTPLPGGERVAVMALRSAHALGRARFQLRGLTRALATADVPLG